MKHTNVRAMFLAMVAVMLSVLGLGIATAMPVRVTLTEAGKLADKLGTQANEIDSLVVEGPIDSLDFHTMWSMAYKGKLAYIDMENAKAENDRIPTEAFFNYYEQCYDNHGFVGFRRLSGLRQVILPKGAKTIGEAAFAYTGITEMQLPSSLEKMEKECFLCCDKLARVEIPDGVTSLPKLAFYQCYNLAEVKLPETLEFISSNAFNSCMKLSQINLPESLLGIDEFAFFGTESLKEITIPSKLTEISTACFNSSGLEKILVPPNIRTIGLSAFLSCRYLKELQLSEGLTWVRATAFNEAPIEKLILPSTLTQIDPDVFGNLDKLKEIYSLSATPPVICDININGLPQAETRASVTVDGISSSYLAFNGTTPRDIPVFVPVGALERYRNAGRGWGWFSDFRECADMPVIPSSGIKDVTSRADDLSELKVAVGNGELTISGVQPGTPFAVYSIDGKCIAGGQMQSEDVTVKVPGGIYIVRAGVESQKVMAR
jgi:cell surface protein